uniref:peptidylprolyl isomerase n=1 Tax=Nelumbo nucifera TaxID=4432 RepID=A0A822YXN3_NELNU|nr:TPA_asm: hypothetical protein HUJ06_008083 [Nelumbo nucifera]
MAFWGIEVKPGKPYTHRYNRGRLKITQATMSYSNPLSPKKSVVQCNVGNTRPILLCSLLPDRMETCKLDLEFDEENEEVVFSVIGARSVYLSGYYINPNRHHSIRRYDDDTDSYGEDIVDTENEQSNSEDDDYDFDDSFINDSDPEFCLPSRNKGDDEIRLTPSFNLECKKGVDFRRKHLKKKYIVSESDEDDEPAEQSIAVKEIKKHLILNANEEDKLPISSLFKSTKDVKYVEANVTLVEKSSRISEEKGGQKVDEDAHHDTCSKRTIDIPEGKSGSDRGCDLSLPSNDDKNNKSETPKKKKRRMDEEKDNSLNGRAKPDGVLETMDKEIGLEDGNNGVTEKKRKMKKKDAIQQEENALFEGLMQDVQADLNIKNMNKEIDIENQFHDVHPGGDKGSDKNRGSLQQFDKDSNGKKVAAKRKQNKKHAAKQEEKGNEHSFDFPLPSNNHGTNNEQEKKRKKKKQLAQKEENILDDGINRDEQLETKVKTMDQEHAIGYELCEKPTNENIGTEQRKKKKRIEKEVIASDVGVNQDGQSKTRMEIINQELAIASELHQSSNVTKANEQVRDSQLRSNKDGNGNVETKKKKKKKQQAIERKENIFYGENQDGPMGKNIKMISQKSVVKDELQERPPNDDGACEQACDSQLSSNKDCIVNTETKKKKKKKQAIEQENILFGVNQDGQSEKNIEMISQEHAIEDELEERLPNDDRTLGISIDNVADTYDSEMNKEIMEMKDESLTQQGR